MHQLLKIILITFAVDHAFSQAGSREHQGPQSCGGRFRHHTGVISTPNFPNPFPVPIKCTWIIENDIINGTISVYFTQQYITSGLTFTEYDYYDDTYKLEERRALTVTEENVIGSKYLKVQSPVLVVELTLNRLEGTQLRALGVLTVFGFNMTYAMRSPTEPEISSCSAIECRLLGHCYASHDYKGFFCSCFEGYSGEDCGIGPLCPPNSNVCKHGGICRQMGPAAVNCICAPGYKGDFCETQIIEPECGIEECLEGCRHGSTCDCHPNDADSWAARFETKLQVVDQNNFNISQALINQITNYFRASNITLDDEIEVLNVSAPEANNVRTVSLRFWGARREAGAVRAALARFALAASRAHSHHLHILNAPLQFDMHPALSLNALEINQRPEVWEGAEIFLTCIAYGSPDIKFTWYKDGVKVNFNGTTRDIWTRSEAEDALGRRLSVLGISEAKRIDSGKWSCAVDDAGRKRCQAIRITVLGPPEIRLIPSALTVDKGENISITCLADAERVHGALGFSWARERSLLPLVPDREVWEDLFPAGSVLKLFNVQKSAEYRCQVSSVAGYNSKGVILWALGPHDEACQAGASHGIWWPKTAPGAHAAAACPHGHVGETTRFCEPKTIHHGVKWLIPDFSGCIASSMKDIYEQFLRISNGYSWTNVSHVVHQYGAVLRSVPAHPGEGTIPLLHSRDMLYYLLSAAGKKRDRIETVDHLLKIYDSLLIHPDAFLDEEKIYELQSAVADSAGMKNHLELHLHEFTVKTLQFPIREDNVAHFDFQPHLTTESQHYKTHHDLGREEWMLQSIGLELVGRSGNISIVLIYYHNLAARVPSLRRTIDFKNGQELELLLTSRQIQLWASGVSIDHFLQHTVTLLFKHAKNYSVPKSKLACGFRPTSEPRSWNTKVCDEVIVRDQYHVSCRCRELGTYALFTVSISTLIDAEKDFRSIVKITLGLGEAMCLAAMAMQLLALILGPSKVSLPVLLKVVTAGTHSAALLALLDCDTRQEVACPGVAGWVCAACWCAGGAALCAQPLLLHAQQVTVTHTVPAVALVAGLCTLALLTGRVWGGSPLQVGSGAQLACTAGGVLLAALTLALAACAAQATQAVRAKMSTDRSKYLAQRVSTVRHTLVLVVTTWLSQAAGVAYVQPGERRLAHVIAISAAALANGLAMITCYVIRDDVCLHAVKRVLSGQAKEWEDSPAGETSLSLYIKQGGEVESRGGVLESSSSHVSPAISYWRAPGLESPARNNGRQATPDSRADIVRCVEIKDSIINPHRYERERFTTTRTACDLIPRAPPHAALSPQHEYSASVCFHFAVLSPPLIRKVTPPLFTYSEDFEPYNRRIATSKENCIICVQSNPDVSKMSSPPIKGCLKKTTCDFTSSISLPSIEITKGEAKTKSDIEKVNREWKQAYESPETDQMLNKITNDLDFLLNRTQEAKNNILEEMEEAPT